MNISSTPSHGDIRSKFKLNVESSCINEHSCTALFIDITSDMERDAASKPKVSIHELHNGGLGEVNGYMDAHTYISIIYQTAYSRFGEFIFIQETWNVLMNVTLRTKINRNDFTLNSIASAVIKHMPGT